MTTQTSPISPDELRLATRNHGMPLEALAYDVTPIGMHYLLIHYDVPRVDPAAWRLEVGGAVERPLSLSLDELARRPEVTAAVTFECAGNGRTLFEPRPISQPWGLEAVSTGSWTGTPLAGLLTEAGVADDAVEVLFSGLDLGVEGGIEQAYERSLPIADALHEEALLAWSLNGAPLPPQHGYPLRLVVPGWYGMTNVKWLSRITVLTEPFTGYQNAHSYRLREQEHEEGSPLARMAVRALMIPPGIPDFTTRRRFARPGRHTLEGRAWSGAGPVEAVEVSADGGATWEPASLDPAATAHGWRRWSFEWHALAPGEYELCCRATDATGARQPDSAAWNLGGYANNAVQHVPVTVA